MGCKDFSFLSRAPGRYPHRPTHRYCRPCVSGRGLGERLAGPAAGCECSSYRQLAVSTNSRREPLIQASPYLTLDPGGAAGWKYVMRQYRVGGSSRPAARAILRVARESLRAPMRAAEASVNAMRPGRIHRSECRIWPVVREPVGAAARGRPILEAVNIASSRAYPLLHQLHWDES